MSTLKQLIKKFCPQGVEYVRLGDVCNLIIGFAFKSNLFRDIGSPVCRTKDIQENKIDFSSMKCFNLNDYSNNLKKYIIEPNDIVIGMSGTIKVGINKTNKHCYLNQRVGKFVCDKTKIVDKFLYYFLCNSVSLITKKISDGSVKNLGNNDLLEMQIPLPSLPVQEEIVKILDKFTDLENELENELRMRKMQFNAYRDKLLTFDNGVKFEKLYKLTSWDKKFNGVEKIKQKKIVPYKYILASEFEKIKQNSGNVKYIATGISGKDQYTTEELAGDYLFEGEIVCIPWGGTPNVKYHNGKFITSDNRIATSLNKDVLNNKFLYYYLNSKTKDIEKFYRGSGIKHPDMSKVLELTIPVPPLEKQKEIVEKLDKFNDMCNEISDGLPLEIELRKKQYEFYRDKLLSFDKKAS